MISIADNYKFIITGILLHLSLAVSAQDPCKIPSITARTQGDEQSCDPIDFGYILEGYTDNDENTIYEIDFGDGTIVTLNHDELDADGEHLLTHTYNKVSCSTPEKAYTFTITAGANCTAFPKTVSIFPVITGQPPQPGFALDPVEGCVNEPVTFNNTTTDGFNFQCETSAEYTWEFGDGTVITTESKDPIDHNFSEVGNYDVKLTVVQECGVYEFNQTISVNGPPKPIFEIGNPGNIMTIEDCAGDEFNPLNACTRPLTVPIRSISTGGGLTETWDITPANGASFSNGNTTSNDPEDIITFTEAGVYRLNLTTQSNCGSENSCVTIIIPDTPLAENITINGLTDISTCAPAELDFSAQADILDITNYQWQIVGTNGTPNPIAAVDFNTVNPAPFTLPAGTYDISITVTNNCGNATATESIEIIELADPEINPEIPEICVDETIELLTQEVAGATYEWFFNGEPLENLSGFSIETGEPGIYAVRVSLNNCTKTSEDKELILKPTPIAEITPPDQTVFCEDETISTMLEANTGAGLTYQWLLDGTEIPGAVNETHEATEEGNYSVIVTERGCPAESEPVEILVVPYPNLFLNVDVTDLVEICPQTSITLTADGADEYVWEPATGLDTTAGPNVVATPLVTTTYRVRGLNGGRCEDILEVEIIVLPMPDIILPDEEVCIDGDPFELDVTVNSAGTGTWEAAGLPAGTITPEGIFDPTTAGVNETGHEIQYRFLQPNGCEIVFTKNLVVHNLPQTEFNIPASVCVGSPFSPEVLSPDLAESTYEWEVDGEFYSDERIPEFTFEDEGVTVEITLRITSGAGCVNEFSTAVDVQGEVFTPDFSLEISPENNCTPVEVGFNNENVDNNVSYQWDFGNGNTSDEATPGNQTYTAGVLGDTVYFVTMEAITACGTFTITDTVNVKAEVKADFAIPTDTVYSNLPVMLPNLTTGTADNYIWDFGDGSEPLEAADTIAAVHNFVYFGETDTTFIVTLTAENECNTSTISKEITVYPNVFFEVTPVIGCEPLTVNFSTNLTDLVETVWLWGDVPGNGTSGGSDQSYTYQEAGIYEPSLIVAYDFGVTDTFSTIITVLPTLEASFEIEGDICVGSTITFSNTSPDAIGSTWDFGDGETFNGVNPPPKVYDAPGTYDVTLTVVNPINNCPGTFTQTIEIPALAASFETSTDILCIGQPVTFNNNSTDAESYRWTFNDGKNEFNSLEASPEWIFETEGIHTVTLEVFSEPNLEGCTEELQTTINVEPAPEIGFEINKDAVCGIWYVSIENETTYPFDRSTGRLFWDFGNGNTYEGFDSIPVQQFVFSEEGTSEYNITLTAETKAGCIETLTLPLEIEDCCTPMVYLPENGKTLAFSPFNGGQNDLFLLKNEFVEEYDLRIYDKWDRMIFQTNDPDEGWDGYFAGSKSPAGVYKGVVSYGGCRLGDKIEPEAKAFLLYLID